MAYKRSRQAFEADLQKQESPYVFYGTPLPPLDEHVRDDGSFVPVWKQEVTDDRGRKRLHGAFTGGFSAGYYNSVGSKEGWTPSTFISSRQNRIKDGKVSQQQRAEDYMDEEDLREAEEAKQLQTAEAFSGFGTEHDERHKGTIMDIFHPKGDSAGVRLLKRMGWKEGQGIGPRVKRPADLGDNTQLPNELHTFAPDDVPMISFTQKHDRKGLGYDGEDVTHHAAQRPSYTAASKVALRGSDEEEGDLTGPVLGPRKPKAAKKKGAFGYGVLNDTGSDDDDDPYSMGPRISYNKTLGGDKQLKKKPLIPSSTANPSIKSKPVLLSKKLASIQGAFRKCHDGRLPLDGFVVGDDLDGMATLSLKNDKYKAAPVPADWKSSFTLAQETTQSEHFTSVADAAKSSTLDARSRASILGEASLPGKSVFDFLSPSARNRLAAASGKNNLPPGLGEKPTTITLDSSESTLQDLIPKLDQDIAISALSRAESGWMPYSDDPSKQSRYKTYLEKRAGLHPTENGDELPHRASGMSQSDWLIELSEFARAAEVFRPVTGLMASRFTSSSNTLPQSNDANGSKATDGLLSKPRTKPLDPAEEAARLGMFGHMTRSYVNFYPTRLLCKRFGLPMPDHSDRAPHDASVTGSMPSQTPEVSAANRFQFAGYQSSVKEEPATIATGLSLVPPQGQVDLDSAAVKTESTTIDPDRNDALEQERPGQALFKAIFGSDDEDDDD